MRRSVVVCAMALAACGTPPPPTPAPTLPERAAELLRDHPAELGEDCYGDADWRWCEGRPVVGVRAALEPLTPTKLEFLIHTRKGRPFSSTVLNGDIKRLYATGWFGQVPGVPAHPPVWAKVSERDSGVQVEVFGTQRATYADTGTWRLPFEDFKLEVAVGEPIDYSYLGRKAKELRRLYRGIGHVGAQVTYEIDPEGLIDFRFDLGPALRVGDLRFEGARSLEPKRLLLSTGKDGWRTRVSEPYVRETFEDDLDRLRRYYRSQGYLDVRCRLEAEEFDPDAEGETPVVLVVSVHEGERYVVRKVDVSGVRALAKKAVVDALTLRPGDWFSGDGLSSSIEAVRHAYGKHGYAHARVDVHVRYVLDHPGLDIVLGLEEGRQVVVEEIRIEGNEKVAEDWIRMQLTLQVGEVFDADEVQVFLNRLGASGSFKDVKIDFEPGSAAGREVLVVRVSER